MNTLRIDSLPRRWHLLRRVSLAMLAATVVGCAAPGKVSSPLAEFPLPAGVAVAPLNPDWWKGFGDARLDALIDEALLYNRDLARTAARIDEARASLRISDANRVPSLSANVSAARQRNTQTGQTPAGVPPVNSNFEVGLNVAYELDLWGRLAQASAASRAELLATEAARQTLRVSLAAQVVQSYAALRSLDAQQALYTQAIAAQREALGLQRKRYDAGDLAELDVRQLEAELAANEGQLPRLARSIGEAERALSLLIGRSPRAMLEQAIERDTTPASAAPRTDLPADLPSDLLQRRPDILQAEARLRAAGARVEVARLAYFPSLSLSAGVGQQSGDLSRLFDAPSNIWSVVASLMQPIWNAGRLDAQRDIATAQQRQIELDYRDAVANAFREARDALGANAEAQASLVLVRQRAEALDRASALTRLRVDGGVASRLEGIEAERLALAARAQWADALRAVTAAQVDVFRALGGGWVAPTPH